MSLIRAKDSIFTDMLEMHVFGNFSDNLFGGGYYLHGISAPWLSDYILGGKLVEDGEVSIGDKNRVTPDNGCESRAPVTVIEFSVDYMMNRKVV